MDPIAIERDKRMRRTILEALDSARPDGISGRMLRDVLAVLPDGVQSDRQIRSLAQDLVGLDMASVRDTRRMKDDPISIDWLVYTITARGTGLLAGVEPVCGLIADPRRLA